MTKLRAYQIALVLSVLLNALLIALGWAYLHFEGLLSVVETAVGFLN